MRLALWFLTAVDSSTIKNVLSLSSRNLSRIEAPLGDDKLSTFIIKIRNVSSSLGVETEIICAMKVFVQFGCQTRSSRSISSTR